MSPDPSYDVLAEVYEFTVPEPLLTPEGSVQAFAPEVERLEPGAAVLDCACGIGHLAVGLAKAGFTVTATDASPGMVARTSALAARHGVRIDARVCAWEHLDAHGWRGRFDAVYCVGNSLTHAGDRGARRRALEQMAGVLRSGGVLVVTSRNWELVRRGGSALSVADTIVERGGRRGILIYDWILATAWEESHHVDVAVALLEDGGRIATYAERLEFWPFTHDELVADLDAAGLAVEHSGYGDEVERYLVRATRRG